MDDVNIEEQERKAASAARSELKSSLVSEIRSTFKRRSGAMEKSTVTSKFKDGRLDRLTMNSPHYSFKEHFGSSLTGTQEATNRKDSNVKSFQRHFKGKIIDVTAHNRSGGGVEAFHKNIRYKAKNHISNALKKTNALEKLATALGKSRSIIITSQIDF